MAFGASRVLVAGECRQLITTTNVVKSVKMTPTHAEFGLKWTLSH